MDIRAYLAPGHVIPAHPLALNAARKLDERRQRALTRYYLDAGAGGIAVGVHTTQFAIREPRFGLFRPVLELAMEEMSTWGRAMPCQSQAARSMAGHGPAPPVAKIAGVCGPTAQAIQEAELAASLGYDAALLSLGALSKASVPEMIAHARTIAGVIPVIGFYLQPSVGGRLLPFSFWREFAEIENVVAIKIAPFNRYQTLDVVRAVVESGRAADIALYTGNDDNIIVDLLTTFDFGSRTTRIVGGLLGHWAVWTHTAVAHLQATRMDRASSLLTLAQQVTDANAALFDPAHNFHGCIAGLHEILRHQGLLEGRWCLDPNEDLSEGQSEEIDRVWRAYPHLTDDDFVRENLGHWLR